MRLPVRVWAGAALVLSTAVLSLAWGPMAGLRDHSREARADAAIASRSIHVSPAEVYSLMRGGRVPLRLVDLRDESAFNRFHLRDARRLEPARIEELASLAPATVKILMAEGEEEAVAAWRRLALRGAQGFYVLEGGVDAWRAAFAGLEPPHPAPGAPVGTGVCEPAVGERTLLAAPELPTAPTFVVKVKRAGGARKGGGCGG